MQTSCCSPDMPELLMLLSDGHLMRYTMSGIEFATQIASISSVNYHFGRNQPALPLPFLTKHLVSCIDISALHLSPRPPLSYLLLVISTTHTLLDPYDQLAHTLFYRRKLLPYRRLELEPRQPSFDSFIPPRLPPDRDFIYTLKPSLGRLV